MGRTGRRLGKLLSVMNPFSSCFSCHQVDQLAAPWCSVTSSFLCFCSNLRSPTVACVVCKCGKRHITLLACTQSHQRPDLSMRNVQGKQRTQAAAPLSRTDKGFRSELRAVKKETTLLRQGTDIALQHSEGHQCSPQKARSVLATSMCVCPSFLALILSSQLSASV